MTYPNFPTPPPIPPPVQPQPPKSSNSSSWVAVAIIVGAVLVFSMFLLASGPKQSSTLTTTASPSTTSEPTTSTTAPSTTTSTAKRITTTTTMADVLPSMDDIFWQTVHKQVPYVSRTVATDLAKSTCDLFDDVGVAAGLRITAKNVVSSGVDAGDVGYIIGAGTAAFCPEYVDDLKAMG